MVERVVELDLFWGQKRDFSAASMKYTSLVLTVAIAQAIETLIMI